MSWVANVADAAGTPVLSRMRSVEYVDPFVPRSRIWSNVLPLPINVETINLGLSITRSFGGKLIVYTTAAGGTAVLAIEELLKTRTLDESMDGQRNYSRSYLVTGTKEPLACKDVGPQLGTPHETDPTLIVAGRKYSVYSYADNEHAAVKIEVTYTRPEPPDKGGGDTDAGFGYEFGNETEHIDTAISQLGASTGDLTVVGKKINFGTDGVDGVDIFSPVLELSEEHSYSEAEFDPTFRRKLSDNACKVNSAPFREWDTGEVFFVGASARKINRRWNVTYQFRVRRNRTFTIELMNATGNSVDMEVFKLGWEYFWVRVLKAASGGNVVTGIESYHLATVYKTVDFSVFQFNTSPLP